VNEKALASSKQLRSRIISSNSARKISEFEGEEEVIADPNGQGSALCFFQRVISCIDEASVSIQSSLGKQGLSKKRGVGGEEVKVVSLAPGLAGCFRYTKHRAHIHKGLSERG
jgi:hypothetical protein